MAQLALQALMQPRGSAYVLPSRRHQQTYVNRSLVQLGGSAQSMSTQVGHLPLLPAI